MPNPCLLQKRLKKRENILELRSNVIRLEDCAVDKIKLYLALAGNTAQHLCVDDPL